MPVKPERSKVSIDCREGNHSICSGRRFLRISDRAEYARCQCPCHSKTETEAA